MTKAAFLRFEWTLYFIRFMAWFLTSLWDMWTGTCMQTPFYFSPPPILLPIPLPPPTYYYYAYLPGKYSLLAAFFVPALLPFCCAPFCVYCVPSGFCAGQDFPSLLRRGQRDTLCDWLNLHAPHSLQVVCFVNLKTMDIPKDRLWTPHSPACHAAVL